MTEPVLDCEQRLLDEVALPGMISIPYSSPRRTMSGPAQGENISAELNGSSDEAPEHSLPIKRKGSRRGSITMQVVGGLERTASKLGFTPSTPKRQGSLTGAGAIGMLAMNKIRSINKAKQARTVLQGLPVWLSKEVLARTTKRVKACKPSQRAAVLRVQNSVMQAEQPIWQKLVEVAMEDKQCETAKEEVLEIVRRMQAELEEREPCHQDTAFFVPGPVGDTVLHACFLLGMVELGKILVEETYNTPELVSLPYTNDLQVWFDAKVVGSELDDGGLYTGQTVLHIAIVRKDRELVQFLLSYGANIVARATGAFFKPKRWVRAVSNPTKYQKLVAWIRGMDLSKEPLVEVVDVKDSGCYYGEFPLSFAVSIGSVELCAVLFNEYRARKQAKDPTLKELYSNMVSRTSAEAAILAKFREPSASSQAQALRVDANINAIRAKRGSAVSALSDPEPPLDRSAHARPSTAPQTPVHKTAPSPLLPPPDRPAHAAAPLALDGPASSRRWVHDEEEEEHSLQRGAASVPPPELSGAERESAVGMGHRRRGSQVGGLHPVHSSILPFDLYVNVQDSFGNTALHMAVLHRRTASMRWLIKNGGERSVSMLNDESYTPLTLAARLGYLEELEVLLSHSRVIAWTFGDVQMVRTPLEQVDTFRMKGSALHARPNWRSVIEVVVAHEVEAMCDHPLFDRLIKDKWTRFARRMHLSKSIIPFFIGVLTTSLYLYARCFHRFHQLRAWLAGSMEKPGGALFDSAFRGSDDEVDLYGRMSAVLALTCLLFIVVPSIRQGWKLRRLKQQDLDPNGDGDVSIFEVMLFVYKNLPFMLTWGLSASLLVGIVGALLGNSRVELQAISVSAVLHWSMLLLHMSSFQSIGVLVIIIFKMLIGDIFKFLVVYVVLVLAFSQGLFALTQMSDLPRTMESLDLHPGRAFFTLVWVSLGGRPLGMDKWSLIKQTDNPSLTLVVYIVYVVLCTLLMLNLLIAMMQKTFRADMHDTYKTWIFPFAQLVLRYESELSTQDRLLLRSGRPAGLQVVHDVESEQFYETAVVPSEKSKREQQYSQEKIRLEVVLQVLNEYLDAGLSSLKHALRALAEEVAVLQGKGKPVTAAQRTRGKRSRWAGSELFEDDDTPLASPRNSAESKEAAKASGEVASTEPGSRQGRAALADAGLADTAEEAAQQQQQQEQEKQQQQQQQQQQHEGSAAAAGEARSSHGGGAPAVEATLQRGGSSRPRRQLTLKRLPAASAPRLPRGATDVHLLKKLPGLTNERDGAAAPAPKRTLTLKKLPQGPPAPPGLDPRAVTPTKLPSLRQLPPARAAQEPATSKEGPSRATVAETSQS